MKVKKFFRDKSIQFKLIAYFLFLIMMPTIILTLLGNMIYSSTIEGEANAHTIQMIDQVNKNVEFYVRDMENITYYISQNPQVISFLNADNCSEATVNEIKKFLSTFTDTHPEIAGILIVNSNDMYISNEMYRLAKDPLTQEDWYKNAIISSGNMQLISNPIGRNIATYQSYSADDVVSFVKAIRAPYQQEYSGVVLIDLKLEIIKNTIQGIKFGKNGFIYIIDEKGNIVYTPLNPIVYRVKSSWLNNSESNSIVKEIKDNRYQIIYKKSNYTGWKTVGVFSLNETLNQVENIRIYSLLIGIITFIIASIAAMFFATSIARPVAELRTLMKRAEGGDLDVHFESKNMDEIGQLGESFNTMISEIRKLINLVYIEQKSKREAELKTLQAQIKPHFFYNTLDTIRWMAQDHEADDIVEVVEALTRLFKISLSKGKEMITVGEEIEHVRSYLIIQKVRYEDKMEYEIDYDEEITKYKITKLVLQPLVENALYHGIKQKHGSGKISITVGKKDGKLLLRVIDNGIGIEPEVMQYIQDVLEGKRTNKANIGYGIFNVNERIRLSFGNKYGLKFYSKYNKGTVVEVWHPLIERL